MKQVGPGSAMASKADPEVELCCLTDPGREPSKQVNEDSGRAELTQLGSLGLVCDGMGGHAHGQAASLTAVRTILGKLAESAPGQSPAEALVQAIQAANHSVYLQGGEASVDARPGSTCVAVLIHDRGAEVAHVGDSRVYLVRGGQIYRMTRDHSVVQQLLDAGMISEEQALEHPDSNRITRALGMAPSVDVELSPGPFPLASEDLFLLTSDGLTDLVTDREILGIVSNRRAEGLAVTCQALIDTANLRGGHDNITVLLMRVVRPPARAMTAPDHLPGSAVGPHQFSGPKTLVDHGSTPTQVDHTPTLASAAGGAPPPAHEHAAGRTELLPTRGGTEPGLTRSPFHGVEAAPTGGRFVSEYPLRAPRLSPSGKLLLLLAALFTVVIVGAILLWWILAAFSEPAPTPLPAPSSKASLESGL